MKSFSDLTKHFELHLLQCLAFCNLYGPVKCTLLFVLSMSGVPVHIHVILFEETATFSNHVFIIHKYISFECFY
eukprot:m.380849 g.380849  ORF g.380849 m.380849 type:complete len:74 (+) comp109124_c0_seq1:63-284(+)